MKTKKKRKCKVVSECFVVRWEWSLKATLKHSPRVIALFKLVGVRVSFFPVLCFSHLYYAFSMWAFLFHKWKENFSSKSGVALSFPIVEKAFQQMWSIFWNLIIPFHHSMFIPLFDLWWTELFKGDWLTLWSLNPLLTAENYTIKFELQGFGKQQRRWWEEGFCFNN